MKKFSEFEYTRPEYETVKQKFTDLIQQFKTAPSAEKQIEIINEINDTRRDFETMREICNIRYDLDTRDTFYEGETEYFDQYGPLFEELENQYYGVLVNSNFRDELEVTLGKYLFDLADVSMKCFSPEIIEDLQKENSLVTKHTKLISSAAILFDGEERNLAQLRAYFQSVDTFAVYTI